ncbi:hypothetical protein SB725_33560, partial [Pseudomonas sp. SIMBA_041]
MTTLNINGQIHTVDAPPDMPLLWVSDKAVCYVPSAWLVNNVRCMQRVSLRLYPQWGGSAG